LRCSTELFRPVGEYFPDETSSAHTLAGNSTRDARLFVQARKLMRRPRQVRRASRTFKHSPFSPASSALRERGIRRMTSRSQARLPGLTHDVERKPCERCTRQAHMSLAPAKDVGALRPDESILSARGGLYEKNIDRFIVPPLHAREAVQWGSPRTLHLIPISSTSTASSGREGRPGFAIAGLIDIKAWRHGRAAAAAKQRSPSSAATKRRSARARRDARRRRIFTGH